MMVPGPILEACRTCWSPPGLQGLECGHTDGVHRWEARSAWFCVSHPALPQVVTGHFTYPADDRHVARWIARHRLAMRRVFAVDPKAKAMVFWVEPDPEPDLVALGLDAPGPTRVLDE